jgi:hypothetical protein
MSRSNPNEHSNPNPAKRWFEWNGEHGVVRYYDKEAKRNVDVGADFMFLLLDQLGSVGGWHDASDSAIYSNAVKDTRQETLIVKSSKGGTIAQGLYRDIKDRVGTAGGHFVANCYIAYKSEFNGLSIGVLRFKGAALKTWMDFTKANRGVLYEKAIKIKGFTEGKKGKVTFRVPVLKVQELNADTNTSALALDKELQTFFASYFKQPKREQVETVPAHLSDEEIASDDVREPVTELTDDDIPF